MVPTSQSPWASTHTMWSRIVEESNPNVPAMSWSNSGDRYPGSPIPVSVTATSTLVFGTTDPDGQPPGGDHRCANDNHVGSVDALTSSDNCRFAQLLNSVLGTTPPSGVSVPSGGFGIVRRALAVTEGRVGVG